MCHEFAMIRRRLLTLLASTALHVGALGLALVIAGAAADSAILIDLVADVEGDAVSDARSPSSTGPVSGATGPASNTPARRLTAAPARRALSSILSTLTAVPGGSPEWESTPVPGSGAGAVTRPASDQERGTEPAPDPAPRPADSTSPSAVSKGQAMISSLASERPTPSADGAAAGAGSGGGGGASGGERVGSGLAGSAAGGNASMMAAGSSGEGKGGIPPEYGPYLERFRRRLQKSLEYPLAARRQGLSGNVELEILLEPSGRIGSVRVTSSSSHPLLDDAALQAVKRLEPEPFPASLPRRSLRIRLPLGFALE